MSNPIATPSLLWLIAAAFTLPFILGNHPFLLLQLLKALRRRMQKSVRATANTSRLAGKAAVIGMALAGLLIAPFGNLRAHDDPEHENHNHATLADGTIISTCWYQMDYSPGKNQHNFDITTMLPESVLAIGGWQIVWGNQVWGYIPCDGSPAWEKYDDKLKRINLQYLQCLARAEGAHADSMITADHNRRICLLAAIGVGGLGAVYSDSIYEFLKELGKEIADEWKKSPHGLSLIPSPPPFVDVKALEADGTMDALASLMWIHPCAAYHEVGEEHTPSCHWKEAYNVGGVASWREKFCSFIIGTIVSAGVCHYTYRNDEEGADATSRMYEMWYESDRRRDEKNARERRDKAIGNLE